MTATRGYRDEVREKAASALREWMASREWGTPENDPVAVNTIANTAAAFSASAESIVLEAAVAIGGVVEDRVRAAIHNWGDFAPCSLVGTPIQCPSRCLKCGVCSVCCAEQSCWHFRVYDGSETLPPCLPKARTP